MDTQEPQQEPSLISPSEGSSTSSSKWFDIIVSAGGRPFPTNKSTLCQNSEYFKSILSRGEGYNNEPEDVISLPSIPQDIFSLLLSGMYSGSLALNSGNAYQVLFYAQLLRMPPAILQCKNFLLNQQLFLYHHQQQQQCNKHWLLPSMHQLLMASTPLSSWKDRPYGGKPTQTHHCPPPPPPPQLLLPPLASLPGPPVDCSTKKELQCRDGHSNIKTEKQDPDNPLFSTPPPTTTSQDASTSASSRPPRRWPPQQQRSGRDLAACDGPVSFQRVANPHSRVPPVPDNASNSSDDEAHAHKESRESGLLRSETVYQCLFCNHTFKSQYCYQKHKQRHLNPFSQDFQAGDSPRKKSLILKDINVQFFPCKICGAKFPSYYFVHKHKKLWHTQEEEEEAENRFRRQRMMANKEESNINGSSSHS